MCLRQSCDVATLQQGVVGVWNFVDGNTASDNNARQQASPPTPVATRVSCADVGDAIVAAVLLRDDVDECTLLAVVQPMSQPTVGPLVVDFESIVLYFV